MSPALPDATLTIRSCLRPSASPMEAATYRRSASGDRLPHFFEPFSRKPSAAGVRLDRMPEGRGPWSSLMQKAVTASSGVSGNSLRIAA